MVIEIWILLGLSLLVILISGLLSTIDNCIMIVDEIKMNVLFETHEVKEKTQKRLMKVVGNRDRHMTAMVVFMTFIGIASTTYLGAYAFKVLGSSHMIIYLLLSTYGNLVLSRTFPKVIARTSYEKILIKSAFLIRFIYVVAWPMVKLTLMWVKIFRLDKVRKMNLTELKGAIDFYHTKGLIEQSEASILQNIFLIKQHRIDTLLSPASLPSIQSEATIMECKPIAINHIGNRILVKRESEIIGILYYRDLVTRILTEEDGHVVELCRPVITVKGDASLLDVMVQMRESKVGQVVVVDEANEAIGAVTAKEIYTHIITSSEEVTSTRIK